MNRFFTLDNIEIEFEPGQTVLQAAMKAHEYIPHLCFHPDFEPHGSCRVCIVQVDGRHVSACTTLAKEGMVVRNISDEIQQKRRLILEMLFIEGNHVCPSCEKSGNCTLQSVAEFCGMLSPSFKFQFPNRPVDASHPDIFLDFNRCIFCELCVRASHEVDNKSIFTISGRGHQVKLLINSADGKLGSSNFSKNDRAATVCPVGVILPKMSGFNLPIGKRRFDHLPINEFRDDE